MTEQIFFDTDCLSSFLWVSCESIICKLYTGRLALPRQVYEELKRVPLLKIRIDTLITNGKVVLFPIVLGTPEADLYQKLTCFPDPGYKTIGRGEASAIVLAKQNDGILGSNNLRDINQYIELFQLKHITTADILFQAMNTNMITESQGNTIWQNMLSKKRMLPASTFSNFLHTRNK